MCDDCVAVYTLPAPSWCQAHLLPIRGLDNPGVLAPGSSRFIQFTQFTQGTR